MLHTNSERSEKEFQETTPYTIASKRIKYTRVNLPNKTKDQYFKNYKVLIKETEEDTKR